MNSGNTQREVGDIMGGKPLDPIFIGFYLDEVRKLKEVVREIGREDGLNLAKKERLEADNKYCIKKLAAHLICEKPELSEKEALEMAAAILR